MNNFSFINYNASEFIWDGPNIPCLKLCHNDKVSDIVYKVGKKVCDIIDDLKELETLDLECLISKCNKDLCFTDRSLINLFTILNANDCSLKDLLDTFIDKVNDKKTLKIEVNLECLKNCPTFENFKYQFICAKSGNTGDTVEIKYYTAFDPTIITTTLISGQCLRFNYPAEEVVLVSYTPLIYDPGNIIQVEKKNSIGFSSCDCNDSQIFTTIQGCYKQLDFTINELLQYLIDRVCCHDVVINESLTRLTELEQDYTDILSTWSIYTEPVFTTCINTNPVSHSLVTTRVSNFLCDIRNNLGSNFDVQTSISRQCGTGLIPSTNLAQDSQNQWITLCDILSRVKTQELNSCCLPDCSDIKIGFNSTYISDDNVYQLLFDPIYGNKISSDWEDVGSMITVEDHLGIYYSYDISLENKFTYDLDLQGLDISKPLTLSIKTKLKYVNSSLICTECLAFTLKAISTNCDFCRVCAGGTVATDQIKLSYYTADNTVPRFSVLSPGSCITFKVPDEAPTLLSTTVLTTGSDIELYIDPSTQCSEDLTLPVVKANSCWYFPIPISQAFNTVLSNWNGATIAFSIKLGFDNAINYTNTFTYKSLKTDSQNTILTGTTLSTFVDNNKDFIDPGVPDILQIYPKVPSYPVSNIVSATPCSHFDLNYEPTGGLIPLNPGGFITLVGLIGSSDKNLNYTYANAESSFGVILELQAQDINNIPELTIIDPLTGTEMIIKGTYIDVCECE